MTDVKCPECNSGKFHYVQRVFEHHAMETLPDEYGNCELNCLIDSDVDSEFEPYLWCFDCQTDFNLDLTVRN